MIIAGAAVAAAAASAGAISTVSLRRGGSQSLLTGRANQHDDAFRGAAVIATSKLRDLLDCLDQISGRKWLLQVRDTACLQGSLLGRFVVVASNEDHRNRNPLSGQLLSQLNPALTVEVDVQDKA